MKQIILSFILYFFLPAEMKAQMVHNVDAIKFKQLIATEDAILLDVRTSGEYSRGYIKGSTSIDISDPAFISKVGLLQKDKTILIYCKLLMENKLVLVDFHAVWCAPCKAMNPVIDKVSTDFKGKAWVEKVDVEANKAITASYQVQSVPGFVLFKEGKKVWSHNGTISYNDLSVVINKYL